MKDKITGIIIGVCIAVTGFHVWFYYQIAKQTNINTDAIGQIISFINKNTAPQSATSDKQVTTPLK